MVIYNPSDYTKKGFSHDGVFYSDLLRSMNLNAKFCTVVPWMANGDFAILGAGNSWLDIGNPGVVMANGTENTRSVYHGNLYLKIYTDVFGAAGPCTFWLASGGTAPLSFFNWLVDQTVPAAVDTTINKSNEYSYESIAFQLFHLNVTPVGTGRRVEYIFTGVKISY